MPNNDKDELLKQAADALDQAERHEEAIKLAFSLVEKGKVPPFDNYEAFVEKVAELEGKNLDVVREALELDVPMADFGKVASTGGTPADAEAAFFHRLAED